MYIAKYRPTIRNSYVQISPKKIENKNWDQLFPKLREISFKAEMSADGRTDWLTDWLTDSQSSLSSFYNIDVEILFLLIISVKKEQLKCLFQSNEHLWIRLGQFWGLSGMQYSLICKLVVKYAN